MKRCDVCGELIKGGKRCNGCNCVIIVTKKENADAKIEKKAVQHLLTKPWLTVISFGLLK